MAKGNFTVAGNNFAAYGTMLTGMIRAADSGAAAKARMPEAKMKNKKTDDAMIRALVNSNDWKSGRIKAKNGVVKLVITDPQWTVRNTQ